MVKIDAILIVHFYDLLNFLPKPAISKIINIAFIVFITLDLLRKYGVLS